MQNDWNEALLADPGNKELITVYADWLEDQGLVERSLLIRDSLIWITWFDRSDRVCYFRDDKLVWRFGVRFPINEQPVVVDCFIPQICVLSEHIWLVSLAIGAMFNKEHPYYHEITLC